MTDKLLPHRFADLFPLLDDKALHDLATDIAENGLREPVVLFEGEILDGRNRYRAARLAQVDCRFSVFDPAVDGDPLKWVLSKNLHRRHLNESQRAMVASRLAKMRVGRPSEWDKDRDDKPASLPDLSDVKQEDAAGLLHVSERSVRTARRVQEHAAPEVIAAVDRGEVAVSAAADLAELPEDKQLEILRSVAPRLIGKVAKEHREIGQGTKKGKRAAREAELAARQAALPRKRYGVIYADPEWRFEPFSRESGMDRAADNHYPTSPVEEIMARPVGEIAADDCVLFLWATVPMLPEALQVMAAWGFAYKSHTIWRKAAPAVCGHFEHPGKLVLGTGYWFRNGHELLLVGTRGEIPAPAMGEQWPSVIDAEPLRHSQKPDRFYELIESYFPTLPRIELNARATRTGWERWGYESPETADDLERGGAGAPGESDSEGNPQGAEVISEAETGGSPGPSVVSAIAGATLNPVEGEMAPVANPAHAGSAVAAEGPEDEPPAARAVGRSPEQNEAQAAPSSPSGLTEDQKNAIIERAYKAETFPGVAWIAEQTGLTPNTIRLRAKRRGWSDRDRQRAKARDLAQAINVRRAAGKATV